MLINTLLNTELQSGFTHSTLSSLSSSLFAQTLILLTSSPFGMDLVVHRNMIILAGNLLAGIAIGRLGQEVSKDKLESDLKYWAFLRDADTSNNAEKLLQHILRVLNVFQHVVENLPSVSIILL